MELRDTIVWSPKTAVVEISGVDSDEFLNRLTTQNVLTVYQGVPFMNCFLNQKGRLVDVVVQTLLMPHKWELVSSHHSVDILNSWINRFWFSEKIDITTKQYDISASSNLIYSKDEGVSSLTIRAPNEICTSYSPIEIGLAGCINTQKGCYIGQEALCHLMKNNYNNRRLMSVSCSKEHYANLEKSVDITTVCDTFKHNKPIAMGVFKKLGLTDDFNITTENGTQVRVVSSAR